MLLNTQAMKRCGGVAALLLATACGGDDTPAPTGVTPAPPGAPHDTLSEWGLFTDAVAQLPAARVEPYEVNSPLFSDYTYKRRFAWIPEGTQVGYEEETIWALPVGTILVKTFSYPTDFRDLSLGERLLETRLMVHETEGAWAAHTYIWDEAQTVAERKVAGAIIPSSWIDAQGDPQTNDYIVPNTNECEDCHGKKQDGDLDTLGMRTRQVDRDGQLARFAAAGWFPEPMPTSPPLADPFGNAPLSDRVRAYLDSNCGHCHTEGGTASESALLLSFSFTSPEDNPANWGVCKTPTSAGGATCGHTYDIVPGDPDSSIMICRLTSTDPEVRMPPLVSRVPHEEGIELIRSWIDGMDGTCDGT